LIAYTRIDESQLYSWDAKLSVGKGVLSFQRLNLDDDDNVRHRDAVDEKARIRPWTLNISERFSGDKSYIISQWVCIR
jgi:hypothetical protein